MSAIADNPGSIDRSVSGSAGSLARFWRPRYWSTWLLIGWMKLSSLLPFKLSIRLHKLIGRLSWRLMRRHRLIVEREIELCFPKLDVSRVRDLVRQHFENLGACLAETASAWFGTVARPDIAVEIEGAEHISDALAKGRGVILYTGHFTPVEVCLPVLSQSIAGFGFMFHRRRNALINEMQRRGRQRFTNISVPNDNVKGMLRALASNAVIWYAPDQCFASRSSSVLPFFGRPQPASTATARLARVSDAAVVPFAYRRLPDDSGYVLRFEPALEGIGEGDDEACTRRLLEVLERFIREAPAQYAWTHQRRKHRLSEHAERPSPRSRGRSAMSPVSQHKPPRAAALTLLSILGVALFIALADNGTFLGSVLAATVGDDHRWAIVVSMFLLLVTTVVMLLSFFVGNKTFKIAAASLLMVSAATAYFMNNYGVIFDLSMIRNIAETDAREASPLMTATFLMHIAAFGVAPAVLVSLVPLRGIGWRREVAVRSAGVVFLGLLLGVTLYANYGPLSFFAHQNHVLRMQINPAYPLYSLYEYLTRADDKPPEVREPLEAARQSPDASRKRTLFVFVMGETARADRFSLNHYERDTNRFTRRLEVVNFPNVASCGTSTADSVPCIFSRFDRGGFSHAKFAVNESLYQTLNRLGIETLWRDNNTGCKEICDPGTYEDLAGADDPSLCHDNVCVDEILLRDFASLTEDASRDHFIVLHQRASHGPAYYVDTPPAFKEWVPECDTPSLQNCDGASINNAYDNTILYTDYFLSRVIGLLQEGSQRYETAMLYVSDHGESLGEKGLYLHGLPYAFAPDEQKRVPMIFWASSEFYANREIDEQCIRSVADRETSHAAIFHSILSMFEIDSPVYDSKLDLFAACRRVSAHGA